MVNSKKLKKRIRNYGFTQKEIARMLGMSSSLFSMKLLNKRVVTLDDAEALAHILNIKNEEFADYFFAKFVA